MNKIMPYIFLLLFSSCIYFISEEYFRIKKIDNGLTFRNNHRVTDYVFLSKEIGEGTYDKGRVYLEISLRAEERYMTIGSGKENYIINGEMLKSDSEFNKLKFLDNISIIIEGKNYVFQKEKMNLERRIYFDNNINLKGEIILKIGRVKINKVEYFIPDIYIQKYRETESTSLLQQLSNEAGHRNGPLYKKTEWIE